MKEHMQRYPESGMTQKAYCEAHGINKSTFAYWLRKHRWQQQDSGSGFVQIKPKPMDGKTEIQYPNGVVLRFSGGVDARYLKELIACLTDSQG